jgi:predicted DNA-binding transcriptional regulator AlpA
MSDLLTLDDIAARWKVKREHARRYLVKRPEFPEPVPGSTRKNQRWRAQDVEQYIQGETAPA